MNQPLRQPLPESITLYLTAEQIETLADGYKVVFDDGPVRITLDPDEPPEIEEEP